MATIILADPISPARGRPDLPAGLRLRWRAFLRRREERRALRVIARLAPHVIRDIGLEPEDVYGRLRGAWDDIGLLGLRR